MATERGPKLAKAGRRGRHRGRRRIRRRPGRPSGWPNIASTAATEAEASLRRALELNPNDIYAQSAMVTLLQDRRQDSKAEALVGLLEEHAGTEELVAAVRDEAKRRQIGRMLVERKVDVDAPPSEPRSYLLDLGVGRRHACRPAVLVLRLDVLAHRPDVRGHLCDRAASTDRLGERRLDRCFQALLMFSTVGLSWLLMMAFHEFGHVLQGWLTGATVAAVHLPALRFLANRFRRQSASAVRRLGRGVLGMRLAAGDSRRRSLSSPPRATSICSPGSPASA